MLRTKWFVQLLVAFAAIATTSTSHAKQPNVLWIYIDDQSPWYSSYGDERVETPNIDALASAGVLFERAYTPTPVCAPARSAIITGAYSIRTGTHDMRSGRVPSHQIHLPEGVTTLPQLFRKAGYETYNGTKDDYNFSYSQSDLYSIPRDLPSGNVYGDLDYGGGSYKGPQGSGHWQDVPRGKPFFGQMRVSGGKSVGSINEVLAGYGLEPVTPDEVRVPLQYPDIPLVRQHIADHYNSIQRTDHEVGETIARLKADGLWENTVVFLFSDHGSDLPRSKEFCYTEGLHVPLIVVAPGMQDAVRPGTRRSDIVDLLDVAASSLALAGVPVPEYMDSRNMFDEDYSREYVFSSADRMSNVIDRVRSVIGPRYHYLRNFMTDRPLINWGHREMVSLERQTATSFLAIRTLFEEGKLTPAQAAAYGPRVAEELYDLESDPDETVNLAGDPAHQEKLMEMRAALEGWIEDTDDKGQYPRSRAALEEVMGRLPRSWLKSPEFAELVQ
ncbi:MAG: sulfatase [Gammaproteobacteria bacterium]|nr:sulfatase [Gammaproteobacteria bacterium]